MAQKKTSDSNTGAWDVSMEDIQKAQRVLAPLLEPTPLLKNTWLSENLGCELYLKLENMQPIGSFKIRGATYRISRLSDEEKKRGVIAASAGNHAQGVAWGSRKLGVNAMIVMPTGAPLTKIQNTRALGAEVVLEGDGYDQAYATAQELAQKTGRVYIHAFENPDVIAGQGTVALEILEQLPELDTLIGSIGGGGLMAGASTVFRALKPEVELVGAQASGSSAMSNALRTGTLVDSEKADTFADGIAVRKVSQNMHRLLKARLDDSIDVGDESIAAAVLMLLEKAKVLSEGAGAVPLAVAQKIRERLKGKKVVLIVSGGNIDVNLLSRIIDRGLIQAGRRVRINIVVSDRPGSLARLTQLIAQEGANIIQAIHDRDQPSTQIDETGVELTLETRGPDHSDAVISTLRRHSVRLDVLH